MHPHRPHPNRQDADRAEATHVYSATRPPEAAVGTSREMHQQREAVKRCESRAKWEAIFDDTALPVAGQRPVTKEDMLLAYACATWARQHKSAVTTPPDHDITYHNHNENIPCGL